MVARLVIASLVKCWGWPNSGNCDNGACRLDGLAGSMSVPASRFPLPSSGANIPLASDQARTVTAADGNTFNQISTNNKSSIDFQNAGVSIKSMILGSGRQGNAYTVRFAPGEYWIETLTMNNDTSIEVTGPVTLYIKTLKMNSQSFINSAPAHSRPVISVRCWPSSTTRCNWTTARLFPGLVYQADVATGRINLTSSSYIRGVLTLRPLPLTMVRQLMQSTISARCRRQQVSIIMNYLIRLQL